MSVFSKLRRTGTNTQGFYPDTWGYTQGLDNAEEAVAKFFDDPRHIDRLATLMHPERTRPRASTDELAKIASDYIRREILGSR